MIKQPRRKWDKKMILAGAGVSFLGAFFTSLFTAPVSGRTSRQKVSQASSCLKTLPARTKEDIKKRKERFRDRGKQRYEYIHHEMDELRKEARIAAKQEKLIEPGE